MHFSSILYSYKHNYINLTWYVEEVFPLCQSDLVITIFIKKFFDVLKVLVA